MKLKIYIAGRFESRPRLREVANKIWELEHQITSTWLNEVNKPEFMTDKEFFFRLGLKDLNELSAADLIIHDTIEMSERGGASNEYGFALGQYQNKLVWIVGPQRSVFHYLADKVFPSWDECLVALQEYKR